MTKPNHVVWEDVLGHEEAARRRFVDLTGIRAKASPRVATLSDGTAGRIRVQQIEKSRRIRIRSKACSKAVAVRVVRNRQRPLLIAPNATFIRTRIFKTSEITRRYLDLR